jgi:ectoine hydroxylase-related dioxygenase (phytanoyl-CoA dioxygenase family)
MFHPVMFLDPEASAGQDSPWERMPDFDAEYDRHEWLVGECEPGDAILHHQLTIHGGRANTSERPRRAVTVNYASDGVTYEPRPFTDERMKAIAGHVPFPRLQQGDPLSGELYPRVWP